LGLRQFPQLKRFDRFSFLDLLLLVLLGERYQFLDEWLAAVVLEGGGLLGEFVFEVPGGGF